MGIGKDAPVCNSRGLRWLLGSGPSLQNEIPKGKILLQFLLPGRIMSELALAGTCLFVILEAYTNFVFPFSLLSMATMVYTMASIYTGKEISYVRVMRIILRALEAPHGNFPLVFHNGLFLLHGLRIGRPPTPIRIDNDQFELGFSGDNREICGQLNWVFFGDNK